MKPLPPARPHGPRHLLPARLRASLGAAVGLGLLFPSTLSADEAARRTFDIPAGDAATTLRQFAMQSSTQLLYSPDDVRGIQTHAVQGEFSSFAALGHMLQRTPLKARQDEKTKAIAITANTPSRAPPPPTPHPASAEPKTSQSKPIDSASMKNRNLLTLLAGWLTATVAMDAQTAVTPTTSPSRDDVVRLTEFEVREDSDTSYGALNSNSITLFNQELYKMPITADIFTETFMKDVGARSVEEMIMEYTAGAGLALSFGPLPTTEPLDRNAEASVSTRGLGTPTYQRDGFLPLASYSTSSTAGTGFSSNFDLERVEVIRGPQSLLYGSGGGGGVINHVSKKARFGKKLNGSFSFTVDNYGHKKGELDLGVGSQKLAARVALINQHVGGRRVFVGGTLKGAYLQLAWKPFENTVVRVMGQQTRYQNVVPATATLVAPSTVFDDRNGMNLHYVLATGQINAAANGPSGTGIIGNGKVTWDNVDSYGGNQRAELTTNGMVDIVVETKWNDWLSTNVSTGYRDYLTRYVLAPSGLIAPDVATNPLKQWAMLRGANGLGEDWRGAKTKAIRFAINADNKLFGDRARSQTVLGADYSRITPFFEYLSYYQKGVTPRVGLPAIYWSAQDGPVENPPLWKPFSRNITWQGIDYELQVNNQPNPALVSPTNPLGLALGGVGVVIGSFYRLKTLTWGIFGANTTEWMNGRLNTILGFRLASDNQERLFQGDNPTVLEPDPHTRILTRNRNKLGIQTGATYKIREWLRVYGSVSSSHNPSVVMRTGPLGDTPKAGDALGGEFGIKVQDKNESTSGSLAFFGVKAKNDMIQTNLRTYINPDGLNGNLGLPSTWMNVDRVVKGIEATLTANPTRDWRIRLVGAWTDGEIGTSKIYPVVYNDQFYATQQGVVTYRDGTPVYVNPAAINVANPVVTATTADAVPLTIAMMNSPTSLYYANPVAVTGQINGGSNAARVLRVIDPVRGPILTGATGLPINQIQINPGFTPAGEILAGKSGDITVGHPEFNLSFTNMYSFSQGLLRGFRMGGTASFSWKNRGYYYYPVAATPTSDRQLYMRGNRMNFNLIGGYSRHFGKYLWSTQVNVSNVFNDYDVKILPAAIGGYNRTANAVFEAQPRSYLWTNTIAF